MYTQRSLYKNTRYLKHKQNRKYKDKQHKFTYTQQHEGLQTPEPKKKHKGGVETEKRKGKRPASENDSLTQFSTPTNNQERGAEQGRNHTQQKTTGKTAKAKKGRTQQQTIENRSKTSCSQSLRTKRSP
jgi:hypothetical protein